MSRLESTAFLLHMYYDKRSEKHPQIYHNRSANISHFSTLSSAKGSIFGRVAGRIYIIEVFLFKDTE